jgi:hypothetical protein
MAVPVIVRVPALAAPVAYTVQVTESFKFV